MFEETDIHLIAPVVCLCSGTTTHKIEHEECRCTGWERFRDNRSAPYCDDGVFPAQLVDERGFEHCRYCGKVSSFPGYLVECTTCGKLFRGPRPYFPIDYDCVKCGA